MEYTSAGIYLQGKTTLAEKIAALDTIIDSLMIVAADSTANTNISEYMLNDGFTTIKAIYRNSGEIVNDIRKFETLRNMYLTRYNGRVMRSVDSKNFI